MINNLSEDALIWSIVEQFYNLDLHEPSKHPERIKSAEWLLEKVLKPLNRDYAVINVDGDIAIADMTSLRAPVTQEAAVQDAWTPRAIPSLMSVADFRLLMSNRTHSIVQKEKWESVGVANIWLKWAHRREYRQGLIFAPNVPQDRLDHHLNTWRGWGVDVDLTEPARPEAWEGLRNHIKECYVDGNERHYIWLMSWLSDILRNPTRKSGSAVVIRGAKGSGKSLLADVMKTLISPLYWVRLDKPDQLTGQFNGHLQSALFVSVEEAFFSGDKRAEGTLKSWITSEDVLIRLMRTNAFTARNYSRFLFTSNEAWTVPADFDDRRFFPLECSGRYVGNRKYFERIWCEMKHGGGFEEFMKYLLTFETPDWVDLRNPPSTGELAKQVEQGMKAPDRFFWNAVKTGDGYPCEEGGQFLRSEVFEQYSEWCIKYKDTFAATNANMFADLLKKYWLGESVARQINPITRKKETVYQVPSLSQVREELTLAFSLPDGTFDADDED